MNVRSILGSIKNNWKGWRTSRKIIVMESDDWGSVRMPSEAVFFALQKEGLRVDQCPFMRLDTIADSEDLHALFNTLMKIKDRKGNPLQITANTIVGNPDFAKIASSAFTQYYFEDFRRSIRRLYPHDDIFSVWQEGIRQGVFFPQLHGREHVNISRWLSDLRANEPEATVAFKHGVYGISTTISNSNRTSYLASFDFDEKRSASMITEIIRDAQSIFIDAFEYPSYSFIAPNYVWNEEIESALHDEGVKYIQSAKTQFFPAYTEGKIVTHHTGEINLHQQVYLVRNCIFEPAVTGGNTAVRDCMRQIATAFLMNKPAIISSHRLNYIGAIDPNNRKSNLQILRQMFHAILARWPEVEFMNSVELGNLIAHEH